MSHYLVERIQTIPNISVIPNAEVVEVHGEDRLQQITVRYHDTKITENLDAARIPCSEALENLDRRGFPRSVRSKQGEDLAFGDSETDALHRRLAAV